MYGKWAVQSPQRRTENRHPGPKMQNNVRTLDDEKREESQRTVADALLKFQEIETKQKSQRWKGYDQPNRLLQKHQPK